MAADALPVRSPLDALQAEFPHYQIGMRAIGDRMFYLAEARVPHVQPRFAQAENTDRLRDKLTTPVREFTVTEPSIPRVWDVLLGGKDNFTADRQQAEKLLAVFPRAAELAQESRQFQRRAVTYAAGEGVRQFVDIGCGLPTAPNTHETAQAVHPDATVIYVDNDEQVMTHAENVLASTRGPMKTHGSSWPRCATRSRCGSSPTQTRCTRGSPGPARRPSVKTPRCCCAPPC